MEGFLSGFKLAPKPLKGVQLVEVAHAVETQGPIKNVLQSLTTATGLSAWLGQTTDFLAHVGIKFDTTVAGETSKAVITTLDLPKRIVFMVEAIGEFDFAVHQKGSKVLVKLVVRRAIAPVEAAAWKASIAPTLEALSKVLKNG